MRDVLTATMSHVLYMREQMGDTSVSAVEDAQPSLTQRMSRTPHRCRKQKKLMNNMMTPKQKVLQLEHAAAATAAAAVAANF